MQAEQASVETSQQTFSWLVALSTLDFSVELRELHNSLVVGIEAILAVTRDCLTLSSESKHCKNVVIHINV